MKKKSSLPLVAEVELVYTSRIKSSERPVVNSSFDAYTLLSNSWEEGKMELAEQFKVLYLNQANKALCIFPLSIGGIAGTVADPRLIFIAALKVHATSLILSHNHPSGNLKPSRSDLEVTNKVKQAGEFLEIKVLDHLILSAEGYYSFADEGMLV